MHVISHISSHIQLTAAAFCVCTLPACLEAQVGLGMSPMRVELRLKAGEVRTGSLLLTNESQQLVRGRGETLDFTIDANGTVQFQRVIPAEADYSCQRWVSLNPAEAELAPRTQQVVRYTIRVPLATGPGSFHCAVGYTSTGTALQMTAEGVGIRTAVRVVAALYVITGDPAIEGGIKEIKVERVSLPNLPPWQGVVVMDNPGLMHYRPTGELALLDREGKVLESQPFNPLPVLPKRQQRYVFPLKTPLEPGDYTIRARVDFGVKEIHEGTVAFEAPPVP